MNDTNAIILAAGRGSRLSPLTDTMPKCLASIGHRPNIENTIIKLQEHGITDITIVVGYLSEKLMYLQNKYNVSIVKNEEWSTTNSITSMMKVIDKLHNTIVIDGDIYLADNFKFSSTIHSGYSGIYHTDLTDEWNFHLNDCCQIIDIKRNIARQNVYAIIDISYWSEKTSTKIRNVFNELKNRQKSTWSNMYWDEVPLFMINEQLTCHIIDKDVAFEFDTINELKEIKKLYD